MPGCATRSYLYVEDVAEAFDVILHRGVVGEVRTPCGTLRTRICRCGRMAHHCAEPFKVVVASSIWSPGNRLTAWLCHAPWECKHWCAANYGIASMQ